MDGNATRTPAAARQPLLRDQSKNDERAGSDDEELQLRFDQGQPQRQTYRRCIAASRHFGEQPDEAAVCEHHDEMPGDDFVIDPRIEEREKSGANRCRRRIAPLRREVCGGSRTAVTRRERERAKAISGPDIHITQRAEARSDTSWDGRWRRRTQRAATR